MPKFACPTPGYDNVHLVAGHSSLVFTYTSLQAFYDPSYCYKFHLVLLCALAKMDPRIEIFKSENLNSEISLYHAEHFRLFRPLIRKLTETWYSHLGSSSHALKVKKR
jgi:hypothetical protein